MVEADTSGTVLMGDIRDDHTFTFVDHRYGGPGCVDGSRSSREAKRSSHSKDFACVEGCIQSVRAQRPAKLSVGACATVSAPCRLRLSRMCLTLSISGCAQRRPLHAVLLGVALV